MDYKRLNELTIRNCYPLAVIDDVLQRVSKGKVFTQIDLYVGFWQVRVDKNNIQKTAFVSPLGLFEFVTVPFGLKNAPSTFQRAMENP